MRRSVLLLSCLLLAACNGRDHTPAAPAASVPAAASAASAARAIVPIPTDAEIAAENTMEGLIRLAVRLKEHSEAALPALDEHGADALLQQHTALLDKILTKLNELDGELLGNYFEHLQPAGTDADGNDIIDPDHGPFSPTLQSRREALAPAWLEYRYAGEGTGVIDARADYYQRLFGRYGSAAGRDYTAITAEHNREMLTDDAALAISYAALGQRIIDWENYMARHPQSPWLGDALCQYHAYQSILLEGIDNTPAFDYDSGKLLPETAAAWRDFSRRYPDSPISQLIRSQLQGTPNADTVAAAAAKLRQAQRNSLGGALRPDCPF